MAPPILILNDIHLTFGGDPLLEGAELSVSEGDKICLVGRNGSGKSTLLKIAAGLVEADQGERFLQPGTTIRYLPQEPDLSGHKTILDYVQEGLTEGDDPHRAQHLLEKLQLIGNEDPASVSGGEARRAALARTLAPAPDILLLDEPTNHLDLPAIEWLEDELRSNNAAMVIISHDRRFLETMSTSTLWLNLGQSRLMQRGFKHFEDWRDTILEQEELERHKRDRKIVAEEHWVTYGVTARRKRNQKRLRALHALREERRTEKRPVGSAKLVAAEGKRSGKLVIEAEGLTKSYDGTALVKSFDLLVDRGDRVGIVGPNGAGKTTLLNMLIGNAAPDAGSVRHGANIEMVTLDQRRESLDPSWTLKDALTGGGGEMVAVGEEKKHVYSYMQDFLFAPEQARTSITKLSGGERNRLMLARALAKPSNLMVLDEPTNDLDLETLDLLQELLSDYSGTVLVVSHDRDFLDRVATSIVAPNGDGTWTEYPGGYSDMMTLRRQEAPTKQSATEKTAKHKTTKASTREKPTSKQKLSFKDKHALETLPREMEIAQQEIEALQKEISDPSLFQRNGARFNEASKKLTELETALGAMEEEWLRLELLKEELEG